MYLRHTSLFPWDISSLEWTNLNSYTQKVFVTSLGRIGQVVLEKLLKFCQCIFANISTKIRAWSFIWTNLNRLYQRRLCGNFCWNWPSASEDVIKVFLLLSPCGKGHGPSITGNRILNFTQWMFCVKLDWNWLLGSGEEDINVKSWQQKQDSRQIFIRTAHLHVRLPFRWAKINCCYNNFFR